MKSVIQRVSHANVKIDDQIVGQIEKGLLVLVGFEISDNLEDIKWSINKIVNMRLFEDENQKMNLSMEDVNGELLLVSQFTLHALTKKGNRPSFIKSAPGPKAEKLYNETIANAKALLMEKVQTGVFGAMMDISLCNSGPVTIILDSKNKA